MRKGGRGRTAHFIWAALVAGAGLAACASAFAAGWKLGAAVSLRETYTDNVALSASGSRSSDWITEVSPSLSLTGTFPTFKVRAEYSPSVLAYARDSSRNRFRNTLGLSNDGSIELVDKLVFLDARASVTETSVSAFGTQAGDAGSVTGNRAEVRAVSLSPFIRGRAPGGLDYELRHTFTYSGTDSSQIQTTRTKQWSGRVGQSNAYGALGWNLDFLTSRRDVQGSQDVNSDRYGASLTYAVDRTLRLAGRLGHETNNYSSTGSFTTKGAGVSWQPTVRTSVTADYDRRFFGNGYSLQMSHRMPHSAFNLGFTRDVTTSDQLFTGAVPVLLLPPGFAELLAAEPDPATRLALLNAWIRAGIVGIGLEQRLFLTNRVLISRRAFGSFTIRGARNALTASASRSESRSASEGIAFADDLSAASSITTQSYSLQFSHALSPLTSGIAGFTRTQSSSDAAGSPTSRQNAINLTLSSRLGARTNGTLGVRRTLSSGGGGAAGYQENAVVGTLRYTFF